MFQYLTPGQIVELHVEITNNCNAACPMCDRNIFGYGNRPGQPLGDWSKEDVYKVFDRALLPNLNHVSFCGTHGDPLSSKVIFDAILAAKEIGASVEIFTNGSLKHDDWWRRLTDILTEKDKIIFGVDGIETNHLYRQNTNIEKILGHMKICCESKVKVRWDFLAFKHNEYEYEKCQSLAKEMGVNEFRVRRTARFDVYRKYPVLNQNKELTHYLEPPDREELRHPNLDKMAEMMRNVYPDVDRTVTPENVLKFFPTPRTKHSYEDKPLPAKEFNIQCIYKQAHKIYVNSKLDVFPCCYISDDYETFKVLTTKQLPYPLGELNLRSKSWHEILGHSFFNESLVKSWTDSNVMPRCVRTCGLVKRESEQNVDIKL